jgi:hypothetical protein
LNERTHETAERSGITRLDLSDSHAYLAGLPETERAARELAAWGETHLGDWPESEKPKLREVRLHEPIDVVALFDFGLTPRHLQYSAETMMKYEKDNPQTAPMLQAFAKALLTKPAAPPPGVPERLSYYKCNMNSIVGDSETIPWPLYTSRLDIEPELAVVYGDLQQPVAGFCIFIVFSAPAGTEVPSHNAPQPYICIVLSGEGEVATSVARRSVRP